MSTKEQRQAELEYLAFAVELAADQSRSQQLVAVHDQFGDLGVIRALEGSGLLTPGAVRVAAATINERGFAGAVEHTRGRLQRIAAANVWLTENKIPYDPDTLPDEQVKALRQTAEQRGITPVEVARSVERMKDPAEAAAEAERVKRGAGKANRMQRALEDPNVHRAAAQLGKGAPALVKELTALAELSDFEAIQKKAPGLFSDAAQAREVLGNFANIGQQDRLTAELDEQDGEAPELREQLRAKMAPPDSEDGWGLSESWKKATPRAQREARPPMPEAPATVDDDWGLHAAWDRAGGGPDSHLDSGTITGPDSEGA